MTTRAEKVSLTPTALGSLIATVILSVAGSIATTQVFPHTPAPAPPATVIVPAVTGEEIKRRLDSLETELTGFREFRLSMSNSHARIEQELKDLRDVLREERQ